MLVCCGVGDIISFLVESAIFYIFREKSFLPSLKAEFKGWETIKGLRVMYWVGDSVNVRKDGGEGGAGCRCSPGRKAQCLLPGIIDGFSCQGSPVLFSLPHFLDGDPKYLEYARGLSPDQKLHQTFLYLEPLTGAPLEGRKRVQMNFQLRPVPEIDILTNVTQGVFPVFWAEEGAELPEAYFEELKSLLMLVKVINSLGWVLLVIGLLLIAGGITFEVKSRRLLCFNKPTASIQEKSRETMGVQTISGVLYPNSRTSPLTHVSTSQVS